MNTSTEAKNINSPTIIKFSTNWNNKLSCDYFTTIRLASPKYQVGKTYIIELRGKALKYVKMIEGRIITMPQMNEWVTRLDTGYDCKKFYDLFNRMYPNTDWTTQRLVLCLFETIPTPKSEEKKNNSTQQSQQPKP